MVEDMARLIEKGNTGYFIRPVALYPTSLMKRTGWLTANAMLQLFSRYTSEEIMFVLYVYNAGKIGAWDLDLSIR